MSTEDGPAATTRYLLFATPEEFSYRQRALEDDAAKIFAQQPPLAIDVGEGTVSIVDPGSNAVITSALIHEVTATPGTYAPMDQSSESTSRRYTQPLLLLDAPGGLDVVVGILPMRVTTWTGHQFRYAWRRKARPLDLDAAYRHERVGGPATWSRTPNGAASSRHSAWAPSRSTSMPRARWTAKQSS
ncbi:hypothetical protein [Mycobacterium sp. E3198]|uniref:hypothetical protein n=1 Tax=Mycobacterium sp. E3198 TaxID=1834143 RepID=UPI0007FC83DA|nr:hypothetical protein [Mycobacterium sp. E3198]OBG29193.1 hypothetical protein A5673_04945 [Mycobacterium sp. E3198]